MPKWLVQSRTCKEVGEGKDVIEAVQDAFSKTFKQHEEGLSETQLGEIWVATPIEDIRTLKKNQYLGLTEFILKALEEKGLIKFCASAKIAKS